MIINMTTNSPFSKQDDSNKDNEEANTNKASESNNEPETEEEIKQDTEESTDAANIASKSEDDAGPESDDRQVEEADIVDTSSWKSYRQYADNENLNTEERREFETFLKKGNHDLNQLRNDDEWELLQNEFDDEQEEED